MKIELSIKEIIAITKSNVGACKLLWDLRTNPDDYCFLTPDCPVQIKKFKPSRYHRAYYCPGCKEKAFLTVDSWLYRSRIEPKDIIGIISKSLWKRDSAIKPRDLRMEFGYGLSTINNFQEDLRQYLWNFQPKYFENTYVEIDEKPTLTGAKGLGRYTEDVEGDGSFTHSLVFGIIDRAGQTLLITIPARDDKTIVPIILKYVDKSCYVFTDEHGAYKSLEKVHKYKHSIITHSGPNRRYREGIVTTNTIENVFKNVEAHTLLGHGCITEQHLQSRLNEIAFKFNHRDLPDYGLNILLNSFSPLCNYYGKSKAA